MGVLLPAYRTTVLNSLLNGFLANTTVLYAFAANPVAFSGNTPPIVLSDYSALFSNDWQMLFGKRLQTTDVVPMITNIVWVANTVYNQYDNTIANLTNFYVISPPIQIGGNYNIYKCINNANGAASTQQPVQVQQTSFTLSDGYTWRYITTVTSAEYDKFFTVSYSPCYTNAATSASAFLNAGVENCVITNGGNGYSAYSTNGNTNFIVGVITSTLIQVQNYESTFNNFHVGNGIYIYNAQASTSQLFTIVGYTSNSIGNFVTLNTAANTTNIQPAITKYLISPQVKFQSDANVAPSAYSLINATSNSISNVVIINTGYGITWCNVSIITNSAAVATNASVYAIVPPPGGHGFDPFTELNTQGIGMAFTFSNSESNTIPTNVIYNQVGIFTNPNTLNSNNTQGVPYVINTFSQVLQGNLSPTTTYAVNTQVTGLTSGALGTVAFCNGTNIYLTGDKSFSNGESISNGTVSATLTINTLGALYTKNIKPLYIQNIANVTRSANNSESYKLVITM